ncbi:MAG: hypothetical protein MUC96_33180, partial [Myxococcaceae bacterium]|nr:hypothetical protein [Myxococcaceae bacterium]
DFAAGQAARLVELLGKTLSYLALLYAHETHESMTDVAYIISNVVNKALEELVNQNKSRNRQQQQNADKLVQRIKLRVVTTLDETVTPKLLTALAEALDVVDMFNVIYG